MSDKEKVSGEEVRRWDWDTACGCMLSASDGGYVESADFDRITEALRGEVERKQREAELRAKLAQQQMPEGWKLVPAVATHWMHIAGETEFECSGVDYPNMSAIYTAMLAAAPAPVQAEQASPCDARAMDVLLMWNRRHEEPPIKVGCEYGVAQTVMQIMRGQPLPPAPEYSK